MYLKLKGFGYLLVNSNLTMSWDKSFADDLVVCGGAVSSRVALLLRSAEAKPFRA